MKAAWSMALRNLKRNKRRNLATGIAIALGFAALLALGGYINRAENYLRVYTIYALRTGHITIYKRGGLELATVRPRDYSLAEDDLATIAQRLESRKDVELHGPQLLGTGLIGNGCKTVPFFATGIAPSLDRDLRDHPQMQTWADRISQYSKGRALAEYPEELGAVALADGLARLLHKSKVHDDFPPDHKPVMVLDCHAEEAKAKLGADANVQLAAGTWSGMMTALDGEIVATFNPGTTEAMNSALLTSLNHLQKLYDTHGATFYSVWLRDPGKLTRALDELTRDFKQAGLDVELYPWTDEDISPMYSGTMQFLHTMVNFISVILATVVVFSIFNAATMTVIERGQEIGMMRSLGFTRRQIRHLYIRESVALAALAVVAGGVIGAITILGINAAGIRVHPPGVAGGMLLKLIPNAKIIINAACLIFVLAVAATLLAVRTVVKRDIATLLAGTPR